MVIGLFYGTDTGNTERASKRIKELVEAKVADITVDINEIYKKKKEEMAVYDLLILAMPTWYDGELQGDWENFIPEMEQIDFTNKKVAFLGLGDQYGYPHYYCDAIGVFADIVEKCGGEVKGFTSTQGYEHVFSKAQRGDQFVGLCIDDVDTQDHLIVSWIDRVLVEFGFVL